MLQQFTLPTCRCRLLCFMHKSATLLLSFTNFIDIAFMQNSFNVELNVSLYLVTIREMQKSIIIEQNEHQFNIYALPTKPTYPTYPTYLYIPLLDYNNVIENPILDSRVLSRYYHDLHKIWYYRVSEVHLQDSAARFPYQSPRLLQIIAISAHSVGSFQMLIVYRLLHHRTRCYRA